MLPAGAITHRKLICLIDDMRTKRSLEITIRLKDASRLTAKMSAFAYDLEGNSSLDGLHAISEKRKKTSYHEGQALRRYLFHVQIC